MKKKGTKNITYTQRLQIEILFRAKKPAPVIAKIVGLGRSTVYAELKRGECIQKDGQTWLDYVSYSANISQERYNKLCTAKGRPIKLGNDYEFVRYVEKRVVEDKVSACAVLGEIKRTPNMFKTNISKTTLYRYIHIGIFENIRLEKRKPKYRQITIKRPPRGTSIEQRPKEVRERSTFGHWEMDCVCGMTRATLLVLTERLTRNELIFKMDNRKASSVVNCINVLEKRYRKRFKYIFKSITVDNGVEFSDFEGLETSCIYKNKKRTKLYYCHPYCSSERGTNERINRDIRKLIPKRTSLTGFTQEDIQAVEDWVNAYPREIHGFASAGEMFQKQLELLPC